MTTKTYTFSDLKATFMKNFKKMADKRLFYVEIDRNEVWDQYLNGFEEQFKQEHNCNCCKSFLRQYAGIVTIENNKVVSIWDNIETSPEYQKSIENLSKYINSLSVTDLFYTTQQKCGTDKNRSETGVVWNHFFIEVPKNVVVNKNSLGTLQGSARDDKNVLKRSLDELTIDATETVLELIAQDSIYRGKEFQGVLQKFLELQKKYKKLNQAEKDSFCWVTSLESGQALSRIRNTAIGTLLIDLSAGVELDVAVAKFDKVMCPANYKRPTALVTPKMVEQAKEKLAELGLMESINRRFANETDLSINDILFSDRPQTLTDIFDQVAKDTIVNPRSFSKVDEISIENFLTKVVPTAKTIEILLENSHLPNMVSLVTSESKDAKSPFKWDNNFSWSYTGSIADSIKEKVKAAGGNVVGELRTSLSWFNYDDLDLHVVEPNGNKIYFSSKRSNTSGCLDVDMNAGMLRSKTPVENIIWTDKNLMKEGTYKVLVHNFTLREKTNSGFAVQIECNGEVFDFEYKTNPKSDEYQLIAEFTYSKAEGIKFNGETKSNVVSKEKWGIKTNQFHKVTKMFLSPNHWGKNVGNKHYFFMLENCVSDETPRPFFNEFLKQELDAHRKVFEILGSKVKIEQTDNQLSGLGFSETQRSSMIVKVTGKTTRTLKVNF